MQALPALLHRQLAHYAASCSYGTVFGAVRNASSRGARSGGGGSGSSALHEPPEMVPLEWQPEGELGDKYSQQRWLHDAREASYVAHTHLSHNAWSILPDRVTERSRSLHKWWRQLLRRWTGENAPQVGWHASRLSQ